MLTIGFSSARGAPEVLALPVGPDGPLPAGSPPHGDVAAEIAALLEQAGSIGDAGTVQVLPRPLGQPPRLLLARGGDRGTVAGRRAARGRPGPLPRPRAEPPGR